MRAMGQNNFDISLILLDAQYPLCYLPLEGEDATTSESISTSQVSILSMPFIGEEL